MFLFAVLDWFSCELERERSHHHRLFTLEIMMIFMWQMCQYRINEKKTKKKKNIFLFHLFDAIQHRPTEQHHSHTNFHDQWLRLGCHCHRRRRSNAYLVDVSVSVFADWIDYGLEPSGSRASISFLWMELNRIILRQTNGINNQYTRAKNCTWPQVQWSPRSDVQKLLSSVRQDLVVRFHLWRWFREKNRNQQTDKRSLRIHLYFISGTLDELVGTTTPHPTPFSSKYPSTRNYANCNSFRKRFAQNVGK